MARRLTCGTCDEEWPTDAVYCGRCGDRLVAASRPRAARRQLPRLVVPVALAALLVGALVATAGTRERLPDAASDVELPQATDVATPGRAGTNTAPRCRVAAFVTSCDLWTSAVVTDGPDPVIGNGHVLAMSGGSLVGVRADDGRLVWSVTLPNPVIWLYTATEDDRHALVVTDDQALRIVDVQSGDVRATLFDVRPVFPGILDGRLAVIRGGATEVVSVDDGSVLQRVPRNSGGTSGRLVKGAFVSWDESVLTVLPLDIAEPEAWTAAIDQPVVDVAGDGVTTVLVMEDGSVVGLDMVSRTLAWTEPADSAATSRAVILGDMVAISRTNLTGGSLVTTLDLADGREVCNWTTVGTPELRVDPSDPSRLITIADAEAGLVISARTPCGEFSWIQDLPGSTQPVIATRDRLLTSGTDGSTLVDLPTGSIIWNFGRGATTAVSARTPIVADGGLLYRLNGSGLS